MQNRNIASSSTAPGAHTVNDVIKLIKEVLLSGKIREMQPLYDELRLKLNLSLSNQALIRILAKGGVKLIQLKLKQEQKILLVTSRELTKEQLNKTLPFQELEGAPASVSLKEILKDFVGYICEFKTHDFIIHAECKANNNVSTSKTSIAYALGLKETSMLDRIAWYGLPTNLNELLTLVKDWNANSSNTQTHDCLKDAYVNYIIEKKNLNDNNETRVGLVNLYTKQLITLPQRSLEVVLDEEVQNKDLNFKRKSKSHAKNVKITPVFTMSDNFEFQEISPSAFFNLDEPATDVEAEEQAEQIHLPLGLKLDRTARNELINYAQQRSVFFQQRSGQQQVLDIQKEIQNFINLKTR